MYLGSDNLLAEIEQLYRSIPVGLCLVDRQLRFQRVNDRLASINGRPVEAHLGRSIDEVIPEIADVVTARYRSVLETGRPIVDAEVRGCLPSDPGVERAWLVSDHPIVTRPGRVDSILTFVREAEGEVRPRIPGITDRDILSDLIDRLPVGVILVSASTKLILANAEARRIVGDGDGLRADWDGLHAATPRDTSRLRYLVACASSEEYVPCQTIRLPRAKRDPLTAVVTRFRTSVGGSVPPGMAMIAVSDGTGQIHENAGAIEQLYGLTPAESAVTLQIARGMTVEEAASQRGIRIGTARTHLKRALEKTGTHRQPELVRLVLTGPALLIRD